MTKPPSGFYNTLNIYWEMANPNPGKILVWRDPKMVKEPTYNTHWVTVINPVTKAIILEFGYK